MGLTIQLCDEHGDPQDGAVEDPSNVLHRLLRGKDLAASPMLSGIDWYGDTLFNGQQMERFIAEWRNLTSVDETAEERQVVMGVFELARRCLDGVHLYLKFVGE